MPKTVATKTKSQTYTVTVTVLESGKLKIPQDQEVLRMGINDMIRWVSKSELDFWIVFEDRTPFEQHALRAIDAASERKPLLYGPFKYHIVLHKDRGVRLDPVVVVDPPPEDPYARPNG